MSVSPVTAAMHCGRYDCGHIVRSTDRALKRALFLYLAEADGQGYLGSRREAAEVLAALALMRAGAPCQAVAGYATEATAPAPVVVATEAPSLTPQQIEVLTLVAEGYAFPEIAAETGRATETVRSLSAAARRATGAHSTHEAAMVASRYGLI